MVKPGLVYTRSLLADPGQVHAQPGAADLGQYRNFPDSTEVNLGFQSGWLTAWPGANRPNPAPACLEQLDLPGESPGRAGFFPPG